MGEAVCAQTTNAKAVWPLREGARKMFGQCAASLQAQHQVEVGEPQVGVQHHHRAAAAGERASALAAAAQALLALDAVIAEMARLGVFGLTMGEAWAGPAWASRPSRASE